MEKYDKIIRETEGIIEVYKILLDEIKEVNRLFDKFLKSKGYTFEEANKFDEEKKRELNDEFHKLHKNTRL